MAIEQSGAWRQSPGKLHVRKSFSYSMVLSLIFFDRPHYADHPDFAQSQHQGPELANSSPTTSAKRAQILKTAYLQYNDKVFNTVNKIDR